MYKIWLFERQYALIYRLLSNDVDEVKDQLLSKIDEYFGERSEHDFSKLDSRVQYFNDEISKARRVVDLQIDIFKLEHKNEDIDASEEYQKLVAEDERLRKYYWDVDALRTNLSDLQDAIRDIYSLLKKKAPHLL
ncbi:MAG: hypothetical protein IJX99_03755 [Clostridia bacterium]|nr:hypothetical protein [Clostridia bacterium]